MAASSPVAKTIVQELKQLLTAFGPDIPPEDFIFSFCKKCKNFEDATEKLCARQIFHNSSSCREVEHQATEDVSKIVEEENKVYFCGDSGDQINEEELIILHRRMTECSCMKMDYIKSTADALLREDYVEAIAWLSKAISCMKTAIEAENQVIQLFKAGIKLSKPKLSSIF